MAVNRGEVLSKVFDLPEYQAPTVARQPAGPNGADKYDSAYFGIPKPAEGLQYTGDVANISNDYFQRLNKLDQFAKDLWLNQKIDVTRPDRMRPESVLASNAFYQELGTIQATADKLKESQSMLKMGMPQVWAGNVTMGQQVAQQPFAELAPGEQGTFTGMTEPTQELVKNISHGFETPGELYRAQQKGKEEASRLRLQAEAAYNRGDNAAGDAFVNQAARLEESAFPYYNPPAEKSNFGFGAFQNTMGTVQDVASIYKGIHPSFKPTQRMREGFVVYESNDNTLLNKPLGTIVDRVSKKPITFTPIKVTRFGDKIVAVDAFGNEKDLQPSQFDADMQRYFGFLGQQDAYEDFKTEARLQMQGTPAANDLYMFNPDRMTPTEFTAKRGLHGEQPSRAEEVQAGTKAQKEKADQVMKSQVAMYETIDSSFGNTTKQFIKNALNRFGISLKVEESPDEVVHSLEDGSKLTVRRKDKGFEVRGTNPYGASIKFLDGKSSTKFENAAELNSFLDKEYDIVGTEMRKKGVKISETTEERMQRLLEESKQ